ncbi:PREDICTED: uncharacterized protein LOC105965002 [Erythranthe guttata]|uniref:uncharacterized protein LOC105965002 n=1 Tax=Erythranthe guttata TaxID=4155 RepID=UPI00064DAB18|nr:PREDICTED: uncharacterized protein LOC105965002 [Erythranthe guttata]|eukprot:XP_012844962.1 PREDICTED: uncharacterized protein LOC105965002 [Erythranthe guttata]
MAMLTSSMMVAEIQIPDDMLIRDSTDPFLDLIESVYQDLVSNLFTPEYFKSMSILAPTNESILIRPDDCAMEPDFRLLIWENTFSTAGFSLFPLMVSFAMTINKSKGHTISHVALYLSRPVFSHGQLYVALSRVKNRKGIKILINSKSGETTNVTNNVVFKEVFHLI